MFCIFSIGQEKLMANLFEFYNLRFKNMFLYGKRILMRTDAERNVLLCKYTRLTPIVHETKLFL